MIRRGEKHADALLTHGDVTIDLASQRSDRAGRPLDLTSKELAVLIFFVRNPGRVLSRALIYEQVWNEPYDALSNTLEMHIVELRRKLEALGPRVIHTVRGRGYYCGEAAPCRAGGEAMRLATRLSAFFLIALALVLAGFSGALYLLARNYLVRQLDERLLNALDTLEASVDIEPGGLEWEPADRRMTLGVDQGPTAVRWAVRDGAGALVDHSANANTGSISLRLATRVLAFDPTDATAFGAVAGWRLARARLRLDELLRQGRGHPDDEPGYEVQYPPWSWSSVWSRPPWRRPELAGFDPGGLSIVVWLTAAAAGRWLCMRALAPVSRMARAATAMTAADLGQAAAGARDRRRARRSGPGLQRPARPAQRGIRQAQRGLRPPATVCRRRLAPASHARRGLARAGPGRARRDRSPEEYRRFLDRVQSEGTRLRQIIESLLLLAQPEGVQPEPSIVDLTDWVPEHLERWASHPRASDLRAEIAGDVPCACEPIPRCSPSSWITCWKMRASTASRERPIVVRAWREDGRWSWACKTGVAGWQSKICPRLRAILPREESATYGHAGMRVGLGLAAGANRRHLWWESRRS